MVAGEFSPAGTDTVFADTVDDPSSQCIAANAELELLNHDTTEGIALLRVKSEHKSDWSPSLPVKLAAKRQGPFAFGTLPDGCLEDLAALPEYSNDPNNPQPLSWSETEIPLWAVHDLTEIHRAEVAVFQTSGADPLDPNRCPKGYVAITTKDKTKIDYQHKVVKELLIKEPDAKLDLRVRYNKDATPFPGKADIDFVADRKADTSETTSWIAAPDGSYKVQFDVEDHQIDVWSYACSDWRDLAPDLKDLPAPFFWCDAEPNCKGQDDPHVVTRACEPQCATEAVETNLSWKLDGREFGPFAIELKREDRIRPDLVPIRNGETIYGSAVRIESSEPMHYGAQQELSYSSSALKSDHGRSYLVSLDSEAIHHEDISRLLDTAAAQVAKLLAVEQAPYNARILPREMALASYFRFRPSRGFENPDKVSGFYDDPEDRAIILTVADEASLKKDFYHGYTHQLAYGLIDGEGHSKDNCLAEGVAESVNVKLSGAEFSALWEAEQRSSFDDGCDVVLADVTNPYEQWRGYCIFYHMQQHAAQDPGYFDESFFARLLHKDTLEVLREFDSLDLSSCSLRDPNVGLMYLKYLSKAAGKNVAAALETAKVALPMDYEEAKSLSLQEIDKRKPAVGDDDQLTPLTGKLSQCTLREGVVWDPDQTPINGEIEITKADEWTLKVPIELPSPNWKKREPFNFEARPIEKDGDPSHCLPTVDAEIEKLEIVAADPKADPKDAEEAKQKAIAIRGSIAWSPVRIPPWAVQHYANFEGEAAVFETTGKHGCPRGFVLLTTKDRQEIDLTKVPANWFIADEPDARLDIHIHVNENAVPFPSTADIDLLEQMNARNGQTTSLIGWLRGDYLVRFGIPGSEHYDIDTWKAACSDWDHVDVLKQVAVDAGGTATVTFNVFGLGTFTTETTQSFVSLEPSWFVQPSFSDTTVTVTISPDATQPPGDYVETITLFNLGFSVATKKIPIRVVSPIQELPTTDLPEPFYWCDTDERKCTDADDAPRLVRACETGEPGCTKAAIATDLSWKLDGREFGPYVVELKEAMTSDSDQARLVNKDMAALLADTSAVHIVSSEPLHYGDQRQFSYSSSALQSDHGSSYLVRSDHIYVETPPVDHGEIHRMFDRIATQVAKLLSVTQAEYNAYVLPRQMFVASLLSVGEKAIDFAAFHNPKNRDLTFDVDYTTGQLMEHFAHEYSHRVTDEQVRSFPCLREGVAQAVAVKLGYARYQKSTYVKDLSAGCDGLNGSVDAGHCVFLHLQEHRYFDDAFFAGLLHEDTIRVLDDFEGLDKVSCELDQPNAGLLYLKYLSAAARENVAAALETAKVALPIDYQQAKSLTLQQIADLKPQRSFRIELPDGIAQIEFSGEEGGPFTGNAERFRIVNLVDTPIEFSVKHVGGPFQASGGAGIIGAKGFHDVKVEIPTALNQATPDVYESHFEVRVGDESVPVTVTLIVGDPDNLSVHVPAPCDLSTDLAAQGWVAHWQFDHWQVEKDKLGVALGKDSSPQRNDGEVHLYRVRDSIADGRTGKALLSTFQGPCTPDLQFGHNDSFMVGAWFYPPSQEMDGDGVIVGNRIGGLGWELKLTKKMKPILIVQGERPESVLADDDPPQLKGWHHVALLWKHDADSGEHTAQLFLDGEPVNENPITIPNAPAFASTNPIVVGARPTDPILYEDFWGSIDDVSIFRGTYDASHVKKLYEQGPAAVASPPQTIADDGELEGMSNEELVATFGAESFSLFGFRLFGVAEAFSGGSEYTMSEEELDPILAKYREESEVSRLVIELELLRKFLMGRNRAEDYGGLFGGELIWEPDWYVAFGRAFFGFGDRRLAAPYLQLAELEAELAGISETVSIERLYVAEVKEWLKKQRELIELLELGNASRLILQLDEIEKVLIEDKEHTKPLSHIEDGLEIDRLLENAKRDLRSWDGSGPLPRSHQEAIVYLKAINVRTYMFLSIARAIRLRLTVLIDAAAQEAKDLGVTLSPVPQRFSWADPNNWMNAHIIQAESMQLNKTERELLNLLDLASKRKLTKKELDRLMELLWEAFGGVDVTPPTVYPDITDEDSGASGSSGTEKDVGPHCNNLDCLEGKSAVEKLWAAYYNPSVQEQLGAAGIAALVAAVSAHYGLRGLYAALAFPQIAMSAVIPVPVQLIDPNGGIGVSSEPIASGVTLDVNIDAETITVTVDTDKGQQKQTAAIEKIASQPSGESFDCQTACDTQVPDWWRGIAVTGTCWGTGTDGEIPVWKIQQIGRCGASGKENKDGGEDQDGIEYVHWVFYDKHSAEPDRPVGFALVPGEETSAQEEPKPGDGLVGYLMGHLHESDEGAPFPGIQDMERLIAAYQRAGFHQWLSFIYPRKDGYRASIDTDDNYVYNFSVPGSAYFAPELWKQVYADNEEQRNTWNAKIQEWCLAIADDVLTSVNQGHPVRAGPNVGLLSSQCEDYLDPTKDKTVITALAEAKKQQEVAANQPDRVGTPDRILDDFEGIIDLNGIGTWLHRDARGKYPADILRDGLVILDGHPPVRTSPGHDSSDFAMVFKPREGAVGQYTVALAERSFWQPIDLTGYGYVSYWIKSVDAFPGTAEVLLVMVDPHTGEKLYVEQRLSTKKAYSEIVGEWTHVQVPLDTNGYTGFTSHTGLKLGGYQIVLGRRDSDVIWDETRVALHLDDVKLLGCKQKDVGVVANCSAPPEAKPHPVGVEVLFDFELPLAQLKWFTPLDQEDKGKSFAFGANLAAQDMQGPGRDSELSLRIETIGDFNAGDEIGRKLRFPPEDWSTHKTLQYSIRSLQYDDTSEDHKRTVGVVIRYRKGDETVELHQDPDKRKSLFDFSKAWTTVSVPLDQENFPELESSQQLSQVDQLWFVVDRGDQSSGQRTVLIDNVYVHCGDGQPCGPSASEIAAANFQCPTHSLVPKTWTFGEGDDQTTVICDSMLERCHSTTLTTFKLDTTGITCQPGLRGTAHVKITVPPHRLTKRTDPVEVLFENLSPQNEGRLPVVYETYVTARGFLWPKTQQYVIVAPGQKITHRVNTQGILAAGRPEEELLIVSTLRQDEDDARWDSPIFIDIADVVGDAPKPPPPFEIVENMIDNFESYEDPEANGWLILQDGMLGVDQVGQSKALVTSVWTSNSHVEDASQTIVHAIKPGDLAGSATLSFVTVQVGDKKRTAVTLPKDKRVNFGPWAVSMTVRTTSGQLWTTERVDLDGSHAPKKIEVKLSALGLDVAEIDQLAFSFYERIPEAEGRMFFALDQLEKHAQRMNASEMAACDVGECQYQGQPKELKQQIQQGALPGGLCAAERDAANTGLVGYWRFDNADDRGIDSAGGHHGEAIANPDQGSDAEPSFGDDRHGEGGKALASILNVACTDDTRLGAQDSFLIGAWFWPPGTADGTEDGDPMPEDGVIIGNIGANPNDAGWELKLSNTMRPSFHLQNGEHQHVLVARHDYPQFAEPKKWHHVAVLWQAGSDPLLFMDGSQIETIPVARTPANSEVPEFDSTSPLYLGARPAADGFARDYWGAIDDVAVLRGSYDPDYVDTLYKHGPELPHDDGAIDGDPNVQNPDYLSDGQIDKEIVDSVLINSQSDQLVVTIDGKLNKVDLTKAGGNLWPIIDGPKACLPDIPISWFDPQITRDFEDIQLASLQAMARNSGELAVFRINGHSDGCPAGLVLFSSGNFDSIPWGQVSEFLIEEPDAILEAHSHVKENSSPFPSIVDIDRLVHRYVATDGLVEQQTTSRIFYRDYNYYYEFGLPGTPKFHGDLWKQTYGYSDDEWNDKLTAWCTVLAAMSYASLSLPAAVARCGQLPHFPADWTEEQKQKFKQQFLSLEPGAPLTLEAVLALLDQDVVGANLPSRVVFSGPKGGPYLSSQPGIVFPGDRWVKDEAVTVVIPAFDVDIGPIPFLTVPTHIPLSVPPGQGLDVGKHETVLLVSYQATDKETEEGLFVIPRTVVVELVVEEPFVGTPPDHTIDVLFAYTDEALKQLKEDGSTLEQTIAGIVEPTNQILDSSMTGVAIQAKGEPLRVGYGESGRIWRDIPALATGGMPEVDKERLAQKADLVVLLVGATAKHPLLHTGITIFGTTIGNFAALHVKGTPIFGMAHELGHMLGCSHQRESITVVRERKNAPYAYQFEVDGSPWIHRTLMGMPIGSWRPEQVVPYYSNPSISLSALGGEPIGSSQADCASTIRNNAAFVSQLDGASPKFFVNPGGGVEFAGVQGGPFTQTWPEQPVTHYEVKNETNAPIDWEVAFHWESAPPFPAELVELSSYQGTLQPSEHEKVTLALDEDLANTLAPGIYYGRFSFQGLPGPPLNRDVAILVRSTDGAPTTGPSDTQPLAGAIEPCNDKATPKTGLVAHWQFDKPNLGFDSAAPEDPAKLIRNRWPEQSQNPQKNLLGVLQAPCRADLILGPDDDFVLSAWVYPPKETQDGVLIGNQVAPTTTTGFELRFSETLRPSLELQGPDASPTITANAPNLAKDDLYDWHHVALVWEDGQARFYIDGIELPVPNDPEKTPPNFASKYPLFVGAGVDAEGLARQFWGTIDDVAVFRGVYPYNFALELYEKGRGASYDGMSSVISNLHPQQDGAELLFDGFEDPSLGDDLWSIDDTVVVDNTISTVAPSDAEISIRHNDGDPYLHYEIPEPLPENSFVIELNEDLSNFDYLEFRAWSSLLNSDVRIGLSDSTNPTTPWVSGTRSVRADGSLPTFHLYPPDIDVDLTDIRRLHFFFSPLLDSTDAAVPGNIYYGVDNIKLSQSSAFIESPQLDGVNHCQADDLDVKVDSDTNPTTVTYTTPSNGSIKLAVELPEEDASWVDWVDSEDPHFPPCIKALGIAQWSDIEIPLSVIQDLGRDSIEIAVFTTPEQKGCSSRGYVALTSGDSDAVAFKSELVEKFLKEFPDAELVGHLHANKNATPDPQLGRL